MKTNFPWQRYWVPIDKNIYTDDDGLLFAPFDLEDEIPAHYNLTTLESLQDTPCLILLGEPGMGKSNTLQQLAQSSSEQVAVKSLSTMTTRQDFKELILAEVEKEKKPHTLVLDSLDEMLIHTPHGALLLAEHLKEHKDIYSTIRVRISCRTWDWPPIIEEALHTIWSEDNAIHKLELTPLARQHIGLAAQTVGIEPEGFIEELRKTHTISLAAKPITLQWLLDAYKGDELSGKSIDALYEYGLTRLLSEENRSYQSTRQPNTLSCDERITIAGRIAYAMTVTKKASILKGIPQRLEENAPYLTTNELLEFEETIHERSISITQEKLEEVLASGLFSGRGEHGFGFVHQTYQEWLASYYIASHKELSLQRLLGLLCSAILPDKMHRGLASLTGWLASQRRDIFEYFLENDPITLFQYITFIESLDDRARLVSTLLNKGDELKQLWWGDRRFWNQLKKLVHPALKEQIEPFIKGEALKEENESLWLAIELIEAGNIQELVEPMIEIILDKSKPMRIREAALYALQELEISPHDSKLKALLDEPLEDDEYINIKGILLKTLWPKYLTVDKLLEKLPKVEHNNRFGNYHSFLVGDFLAHIQGANNWKKVLDWLSQEDEGDYYSGTVTRLISTSILATLPLLSDQPLQDSLITLLTKRGQTYRPIFDDKNGSTKGNTDFNKAKAFFNEQPELRRHLLERLVEDAIKEGDRVLYYQQIRPLFCQQDDMDFYIKKIKEASDENTLLNYILLARDSYEPVDTETQELLRKYYFSDDCKPEFKRYFTYIFEPDKIPKQNFDYDLPNREPLCSAPHERVLNKIKDIEKTKQWSLWWSLIAEMSLTAACARHHEKFDHDDELDKYPGWLEASTITRNKILKIAFECIKETTPKTWNSIKTNSWALFYNKSLKLLVQYAPEKITLLDNDFWNNWIPEILFGLDNDTNDTFRKLMTFAVTYAKPQIIETFKKIIELINEPEYSQRNISHNILTALARIGKCLIPEIHEGLRSLRTNPRVAVYDIERIFFWLLRHNDEYLIQEVREELLEIKDKNNIDILHRLAVTTLTAYQAKSIEWSIVWTAIQTNELFGKEFLEELASDYRREKTPLSWSVKELSELYQWVATRYPSTTDRHYIGVYTPLPDDHIRRLRGELKSCLANFGNQEAHKEILRLYTVLPDERPTLDYALFQMQQAEPLPLISSHNALYFLKDPSLRIIQSEEHLLSVVVESLSKLQSEIISVHPKSIFLWDQQRVAKTRSIEGAKHSKSQNAVQKSYAPKDEAAISAYVLTFLQQDLRNYIVVSTREEELRPSVIPGTAQRTDIIVNVIGQGSTRLSVVIEVKGGWNDSIPTAMKDQLIAKYLINNQYSRSGIFLIAYFPPETYWYSGDRRKSKAKTLASIVLGDELIKQAETLSHESGVNVKYCLLRIPLVATENLN